jgi:hypothetical protein
MAQWAIAAATLAAAYRGHTVIRGLGWKKRVSLGGARSEGPTAPQPVRDGTLIPHPAGVILMAHALGPRSRRGVHAASPRP